jgi:hypothetical protein
MNMVEVQEIPPAPKIYKGRETIDKFIASGMKIAKLTDLEEDPSKLYFSCYQHCRNFDRPVKVMFRQSAIYLQLKE